MEPCQLVAVLWPVLLLGNKHGVNSTHYEIYYLHGLLEMFHTDTYHLTYLDKSSADILIYYPGNQKPKFREEWGDLHSRLNFGRKVDQSVLIMKHDALHHPCWMYMPNFKLASYGLTSSWTIPHMSIYKLTGTVWGKCEIVVIWISSSQCKCEYLSIYFTMLLTGWLL